MKTSKVVMIAMATMAILGFTACGVTTKVNVTTDQAANFNNYRTFGWMADKTSTDEKTTAYNNEIVRNNIRHYTTEELQKQGYTLNNDNPDIWLQLQFNDRPMQEVNRYNNYSPYGMNYGLGSRLVMVGRRLVLVPSYGVYSGFGYGYPYSTTSTHRFDRSDLTINIIDRSTNKLIGVVVGTTDTDNPNQFNKNLKETIAKIVKKSPLAKPA